MTILVWGLIALFAAGAAFGLIKIAKLTYDWLRKRLKERMTQGGQQVPGTTVTGVIDMDLLKEKFKEARREGKVKKIDYDNFDASFMNATAMMAGYNEETDELYDIEGIEAAEGMDEYVRAELKENDGIVVFG